MITYNILSSFTILLLCGLLKGHDNKIKELEKLNKKHILDINALHKNQNVITSSIRELHQMIKRYDKGAKKQIRIDSIKEG
jgi:hypothetical protein